MNTKTVNYDYNLISLKEKISNIKHNLYNNYVNVTKYYPELNKYIDRSESGVYNNYRVMLNRSYYRNSNISNLIKEIVDGFELKSLSKKSLKRVNRFLWKYEVKPNTHRLLKLIRFVALINDICIKLEFELNSTEKMIQLYRKAYRESVENLKKDHILIKNESKEKYLKEKGNFYKRVKLI